MKKSIYFNAVLIVLITFSTVPSYSQGAKIAKELNDYIMAPGESGFKPLPDGSEKGEATHYIGGQKVEETNSVIYKAFEMHPEWSQMTVVADWTGSMYAYVGQIMRWHKLNIEKKLLKNLVLFNDGDDNVVNWKNKTIGATGGIYYPNPDDMDDFLGKVKTAIDNGDGMDSEENDVEAILAAQKKYPGSKEIILIADNTSIRDIELVTKINRPVHVLLCNGGWVYDYVKLAYETGGSIISQSDDIDFSNKNKIDPDNIIFNGVKYTIK